MTTTMENFESLLREAESQMDRLKQMAEENVEVSPVDLLGELHDTVLSLVVDLGAAALGSIAELHQYLHEEVEPVLLEAAGEVDDSLLLHEDAQEISALLHMYRASIEAGLQVTPLEGAEREQLQAVVQQDLGRIDAVLARIEEIRLPEDEDEDEDEDEEYDEDNEAELSEEGEVEPAAAAPAGAPAAPQPPAAAASPEPLGSESSE